MSISSSGRTCIHFEMTTQPFTCFVRPSVAVALIILGLCALAAKPVAAEEASAFSRSIIGGDLLRISVEESPDLNGEYPVAGDGYIDFGFVGRVSVEGKTLEEASLNIKDKLERTYFKAVTLFVEVSDHYAGNIMILGAVRQPGTIPFKGNQVLTLLEAIVGAGGLTEQAAADQTKIFRRKPGGALERQVIEVDLRRVLDEYDFSRDQYLRPRDIVVVPEMGDEGNTAEFLALGEFAAPGFHPVFEGINMIKAVTLAGGVTRGAQLETARILRPGSDGNYSVIPVDLARLFGSADMSMNLSVFPGDILFLPSASQASSGIVYFLGEINNPGIHALPVAGNATLARIMLVRGGLSSFSNGSAVRVLRKVRDGKQETLVFDVDQILKSGQFDRDLPLQDGDVIIVPKRMISLF